MANNLPTCATISEWLSYDAANGVFIWAKESRPSRPLIGKIAGTRRGAGYIFIGLRGWPQLGAHRLAWIYQHGSIPPGMEIDHIDGDPTNNRMANLRLATSSQQKMNKRTQSNNRSGLKGAYYHACRGGKKWRSQIKVGRRLIFLGYFDTATEAHAAYAAAAPRYFGEFGRAA